MSILRVEQLDPIEPTVPLLRDATPDPNSMPLVGRGVPGSQEIYFSDQRGYIVQRKTLEEAHETGHLPYTISATQYGGFRVRKVVALNRRERLDSFVRITTRRGREIVVTADQPVFTRAHRKSRFGETRGPKESGYLAPISARSLAPRMSVATLGYWVEPYRLLKTVSTRHLHVPLNEPLMELIGFWLGDGSRHGGKLRLSLGPGDEEIHKRLEQFGAVSVDRDSRSLGWGATLQPDAVYAMLVDLGVAGKHQSCYNKRVPAWVFGARNELVAGLLRGYFSTDGSFSGHNLEVSSASGALAEDISLLLLRFDIIPSLAWKYKIESHIYHRRLTVSKAAELQRFAAMIGFVNPHKQGRLEEYLRSVPQALEHKRTKHKRRYSLFWDEVETVKTVPSDDRFCYSLQVLGTEKYVSSGIVLAEG